MIPISFKKYLSQNFLIDKNIIKNIIENINISRNDIIIEIGSGTGLLSVHLLNKAKKTILIEIDKSLIKKLQKNIKNTTNAKIYNEDILKFDFKSLIKQHKKIRIIGNIPYKISTKILILLNKYRINIKDIHLVIQSDLIKKLTQKKQKNLISKTILNNFNFKNIFNIKASSFKPKPKINSAFIKLTPKNTKNITLNNDKLYHLMKLAFTNKRKKLYKSIKNIEKYKKYINIKKRPNEYNLKDFIRINNLLIINKND